MNSGSCGCVSGYALNSSNQCQACSVSITNCLTCSNTTYCNSCGSGFTVGTSSNGQRSCQSCSSTIAGCLTCSSNTVCLSCNTSNLFTLNSTTGKCDCSSGYILNTAGTACQACNVTLSNCLTCISTSNCTSCKAGFYKSTQANGVNCSSCTQHTGCLECSNLQTCTLCNTAANFQLNGNTCQCKSGYFLNSTSNQCQVCTVWSAQCLTCSTTGCLTCAANYVLNGTGCKQSCNITGCVACQNVTACATCGPNFYLSNKKCYCSTGYTLVNNSCQACNSTLTGCVQCSSNSSCDDCDDTYYLDIISDKCEKCGFGCKTCTCFLCLGCLSNAYINTVLFDCLCVSSAYKNTTTNTCEFCNNTIANCNKCSNSTYCTSCTNGLWAINGTCGCYSNQYYNTNIGICSNCQSNCLECSGATTCTKCDASKRRELKNGYCSCKPGYTSLFAIFGYSDGSTCF